MTASGVEAPTVTAQDLTLEEKASLCSGADLWHTKAVERAGVASLMLTDGPHGLRKQATAGERVELGQSVPATCFPTAAGLGSSFDADLVRRVGEALGRECRAEGVAVLLGPGVNIKRSPLCGRNFEYFSEDPVVSGVLGAALVRGVQSEGVGTSVKHYAANNQETDRMRVSAEVDERTLREVYLASFERIVTTARPWTVMCSYNKVNGTYASQHPWLLTTVLRDEWGFDGVVMSDWGAVDDRVAGIAAGLDLEMPSSGGLTDAQLVSAVRAGELDEAVLDRSVDRLLELVRRTAPGLAAGGEVDPTAHHTLAREVARDCAVLLKNAGGLLPLDPAASGVLAVVGELARTPRYQGAGSSQVHPTRLDAALGELEALAGPDLAVRFAPGYSLDRTDEGMTAQLRDEAVELARDAATTVLFLGLPASAESEGFDREHLDLPPVQVELLRAVSAVSDRVVVVLSNGSVVTVSDWEEHAGAILEAWLPGQAGGGALADLLLGVASPSGRLAETLPLRLADTPAYGNFPGEHHVVRYGEGLWVGYRWYDAREMGVSYPFGHGLTYTTFSHGGLSARVHEVDGDAGSVRVEVAVTVTNTGARAGKDVVQVYLRRPESALQQPVRALVAFAKVALEPGESREVSFTLGSRDLSSFSTALGRWAVERGEVVVEVGSSSRDVDAATHVRLAGEPLTGDLDASSTIVEWLAHPRGSALLRRALSDEAGGGGAMADEELLTVIGGLPLERLVRFPGSPLDVDAVGRLVAEAAGG